MFAHFYPSHLAINSAISEYLQQLHLPNLIGAGALEWATQSNQVLLETGIISKTCFKRNNRSSILLPPFSVVCAVVRPKKTAIRRTRLPFSIARNLN
ncbi:hypothetical protein Ppro_2299 [Pelobacter propionicus DSM 2379]|uniref:Uncharacterized protein n=1 Tax=Pelobacter propionicus (strain DSM 2379 / NBRC 103807 / OttBd1) TaxID=338966 RepID=A1ARD6_PELPD|nr:hypothetical protein Ppro_2299 [Pelobacter propionicus DSM 2379]